MKKFAIILLSFVLAAPAFAQESTEDLYNDIYTTENGVFSFNIVDHVGWGYHFVKTEDFTPSYCGDYFINILAVKVRPTSFLTLKAGLDCEWNDFGSKKTRFYRDEDDHTVQATDFSGLLDLNSGLQRTRSYFGVYSFSVPVLAKLNFGKFEIGGGAEMNFNVGSETSYSYERDDTRSTHVTNNIKLNTFTYNFVAMVGFDGIDIFAKFYPKASRPLAAGSITYNYMTFGVAFGL